MRGSRGSEILQPGSGREEGRKGGSEERSYERPRKGERKGGGQEGRKGGRYSGNDQVKGCVLALGITTTFKIFTPFSSLSYYIANGRD